MFGKKISVYVLIGGEGGGEKSAFVGALTL